MDGCMDGVMRVGINDGDVRFAGVWGGMSGCVKYGHCVQLYDSGCVVCI